MFFLDERQHSSFCEKIDIHSVILWENVGHLPRFVRYIIAEKEQLRPTLSSLFSLWVFHLPVVLLCCSSPPPSPFLFFFGPCVHIAPPSPFLFLFGFSFLLLLLVVVVLFCCDLFHVSPFSSGLNISLSSLFVRSSNFLLSLSSLFLLRHSHTQTC